MYHVRLGSTEIGTTLLEFADPPMGVVYGKICFSAGISPFRFFLDYCRSHDVPVNGADPELEFIDTQVIPELRVFRPDGVEIGGQGCYITGLKDDGYLVTVYGVPYPFYAEEFPHHCEAYEERFKS